MSGPRGLRDRTLTNLGVEETEEERYEFNTQETSTKKVWSGSGRTLCIKDFFTCERGKKMGKLARDVHEGKVVLRAIAVAVYSQRSHRWNSGAGSRQIVDILINNYYSDKDNLRSWTEDHVDAKCALSTLFYGRRRSTRLSSGYLERISFLFFFYIARGELLTKVSVEETRCLSG